MEESCLGNWRGAVSGHDEAVCFILCTALGTTPVRNPAGGR